MPIDVDENLETLVTIETFGKLFSLQHVIIIFVIIVNIFIISLEPYIIMFYFHL